MKGRKMLALLLCAVMLLAFAGCNDQGAVEDAPVVDVTPEEMPEVPESDAEQEVIVEHRVSAEAFYQVLGADREAYRNYTFYAAPLRAEEEPYLTYIVEHCTACRTIESSEPQAFDLDAGVYAIAFVDNANHENRDIRTIWVKESGGADTLTIETDWETEYVPDVTFSASIGEIDGTIYCARKTSYEISQSGLEQLQDIPTCKLLPVETGEYTMVASFCYYDGYVYYIETEGGSSDYSTWLYRCKKDWSEKELLDEIIYDWNDPNAVIGERFFVIDHGVLYYDIGSANYETTAIDLTTMEKFTTYMPVYTISDNGYTYERSHTSDYDIAIYNNTAFFTDENHNLYIQENDSKRLLTTNAYLDGGYTGEYLYYAEYNWEISQEVKLYRVSLSTGEKEYIDSRMPAGGGGPYFCW